MKLSNSCRIPFTLKYVLKNQILSSLAEETMQGRKLCKNSNQQIAFTPKLKTISGFLKVWGGASSNASSSAAQCRHGRCLLSCQKVEGQLPPGPPFTCAPVILASSFHKLFKIISFSSCLGRRICNHQH